MPVPERMIVYARDFMDNDDSESEDVASDGEGNSCAGRRKKSRALKDPNAPKRALSSYLIFSNEQRGQVQMQFPGLKVTGKVHHRLVWFAISLEDQGEL